MVLNDGPPAPPTTPASFAEAFSLLLRTPGGVPGDYLRAASGLRAMDPALIASESERRAFFINLYNAMVYHGARALGLRKTVWERPGFFRRVRYEVAGRRLSLHEIEHGILRGNKKPPYGFRRPFPARDPRREWSLPLDPRIHFALNCGARSCPPVKVFQGPNLDAQLDLAARAFMASDVLLDEGARVARVPRFFLWFRGDFGDSRAFLSRHLGRDFAEWTLEFRPYDWSLFLKVEE